MSITFGSAQLRKALFGADEPEATATGEVDEPAEAAPAEETPAEETPAAETPTEEGAWPPNAPEINTLPDKELKSLLAKRDDWWYSN
jgi:hypothetical protein